MTYEELVAKLRKLAAGADARKVKEHIAIQFNVYGEGEGALYAEIKSGCLYIEPYEYYDRDALVYAEAQTLIDLFSGKLPVQEAYESGKMVVQGRHDATLKLAEVILEQA